MINFLPKLRMYASAIAVGNGSDGLLFIDKDYRVYKTNPSNDKFVVVKQIFKDEGRPLHEYTKAADCGDDLVLLPKLNSRINNVFKIDDKKISIVKRLSWHKGYISVSSISPDSKYIATGGEDGRSYIYNGQNFNLHTILPACPDYISCITFSSDSNIVVYCSYKPQVMIYDIDDDEIIANLEVNDVPQDCTFFDDDKKIFFVCRNGDTAIYDLQKKKLNIKNNYDTWLMGVALNLDKTYAYIAARNDILYLHRLIDNSPMANFRLDSSGVNKVKRIDGKVYFCCIDGSVIVLNATKFLNEFIELLKTNDFRAAHKFANEKNILLRTLKIYELLRLKMWPQALEKAVEEIKNGNLQKALDIVAPFVEDPRLDHEFQSFLKNQELIMEFIECLHLKNYKRCYEIHKQMPQIAKLKPFKDLEREFLKQYELAKHLIIKDPSLNANKAKEILEPFLEVESKKPSIDILLNNAEKFALADKMIKDVDFKGFFDLCYKYDFLKDTKYYAVAFKTCQKMLDKALNQVFKTQKDDNLSKEEKQIQDDECLKALTFLQTLYPFESQARELLDIIEYRDKFMAFVQQHDYKKCYELIESHKELQSLQEVIDLDTNINKLLNRCIEKAYDGNPREVYDSMKSLIHVPRWSNRTRSIMKISFLYSMEHGKKKEYDAIDWMQTFSNYIKIFGRDNELLLLCNDDILRSALNAVDEKQNTKAKLPSSVIAYIDKDKEDEYDYEI